MTLYELMASVTLDSSGYEGGVKSVMGSSDRLSAKAVAVGKVMADAFEAVIKVLGRIAKASIDTGKEFETSFAKVKTIMNPSEMGFDDMEDAIINLSKQTGISASELSDTVYNVISATGDTAHAVELAEQASKLATAGFTDSGSALSVLTSAINAYGLEVSDASKISDSMIAVQNTGITTVSELSSVMGKSIATAAAYNVDLENLETTFISLTKAGIPTAETATYMSSMMNELGKSGSDVSKILKKKTGKTFGELMGEGKSLGDVLEVLYDSCNGDAEAFMNLWGSAEAGKAASAVAKQGFDNFEKWLGDVRDSAGATEKAYAIMADTLENKTARFKTTVQSKLIQVFEAIAPVLGDVTERATAFIDSIDVYSALQAIKRLVSNLKDKLRPAFDKVRDVAERFKAVLPEIKAIVDEQLAKAMDIAAEAFDKFRSVVDWIIQNWRQIAPFAAAIGGLVGSIMALKKGVEIIDNVKTAINGLKTGFMAIKALMAANPLGVVIVALSALAAAFVTAYNTNDEFKAKVDAAWSKIKEFLIPIIDSIKKALSDGWETLKETLGPIIEAIAAYFSSDTWAATVESFGGVMQSLKDFISAGWDVDVALVTGFIDIVKALFTGDWETIKETFGQVFDNIREAVSNGWDAASELVTSVMNTIKTALGGAWPLIVMKVQLWIGKIKAFFTGGWDKAVEGIKGTFEDIKGAISGAWGDATGAVSEAVNGIKEKVKTGFKGAYTEVVNRMTKIKDKIKEKIDAAKEAVKKAIEKIKGFFDWSGWKIKLPTLPKLNVSWETTSGGLFSGLKYPTFSWNARAMDNPLILGNATIFGASGGTLEGGGERGEEIVGGKDTIMGMIGESVSKALNESMNSQLESIYSLLSNQLPQMASAQVVLDSGALVGSTVREMDRALGAISARKKRGGL